MPALPRLSRLFAVDGYCFMAHPDLCGLSAEVMRQDARIAP
ncbi:MAG TPA: hypothetical protein PKA05_16875 [Roseiflexaceae bacterium]|nr:hypothetical protein [Roseiflexaceae bacterium]